MIRDPEKVAAFEREEALRHRPDHAENLRIYEALYEEARLLGVLPPADPLDGIEVDLRIAWALNVCRAA